MADPDSNAQPAGLTYTQLSRAVGLTPKTLRKYQRTGVITGVAGRFGHMRFDPEAAKAGIAAYTGTLQGGKREGAGRKRVGSRKARPVINAGDILPGSHVVLPATAGVKPPEPAEEFELDSAEGIGHAIVRMPMTEASRRRTAIRAVSEQLRLNQTRGLLIDVREAEAAIGQTYTAAQYALAGIPDRMAPQLAAELELDERQMLLIKERLTRHIDEVLDMLASDPMGLKRRQSGSEAA